MKYMIQILSVIGFGVILLILPRLIPFSDNQILIRLTIIGVAFLLTLRAFKKLFYNTQVSDSTKSNLMSGYVVIIMILILEGVFSIVPKSNGSGHSYGAKLWFRYYWRPMNSYAFRDEEPQNHKKTIFFVGDSFTAAQGINSIEDRFSNLVGKQLEGYQAITLAVNGADTRREYSLMRDFIDKSGITPDVIVLNYFGNDIDKVAMSKGLNFEGIQPYEHLGKIPLFFIEGSYLVNFLYWSFPHASAEGYIAFLEKAYNDSAIFQAHKKDLKQFIYYANEHDIKMYVTIIPFMQDVEFSNVLYGNKISTFFKNNQVETIDLGTTISDIDANERTINANDGHASKLVHKRFSEKLIEVIGANKAVY